MAAKCVRPGNKILGMAKPLVAGVRMGYKSLRDGGTREAASAAAYFSGAQVLITT